MEATLVDDIGGFVAALRDDVIGAEAVGGGFEVGKRELREGRDVHGGASNGVIGAVRGGSNGVVRMRVVLAIGIFGFVRLATTH